VFTLTQAVSNTGGITIAAAAGSRLAAYNPSGAAGALVQTNILSTTSTTPFGSGTIALQSGQLGLGTAGALSSGQSVVASGNPVTFQGQSSIRLKAGSGSTTLATASLTRVGNGVLLLAPTSGSTLGSTEKVTVASGAPTVTNGMVAPYYVDGSTQNFLTYDATAGFKDATYTVTGSNANGTISSAGATAIVSATGNAIRGNGALTVYALKWINTAATNNGGPSVSDSFNILSGGLILVSTGSGGGFTWSANSGNINFGASEGVLGAFFIGTTGGSASVSLGASVYGHNGFTKYGNETVSVSNLQVTGGVTIAGGTLSNSTNFNAINTNNTLTVENGAAFQLYSGAARSQQVTGLLGSGSVLWDGTGSSSSTLTIDGLNSTGTSTFSGSISNTSTGGTGRLNLTKRGLSTQVLTGSNSYGGTTAVNGGTLRLDFSAAGAPASNIINNTVTTGTSSLSMGGGTLDIVGNAATTNSQQFAGLTVAAGNSTIKATSGAGGAVNANLGSTLTNNMGGTVDFNLPSSGSITTAATTTSSNGIWVSSAGAAFATVGGTTWATVTGGMVGGLSSYATNTFSAGSNTDITSNQTPGSAFTVNSLRFNTATSSTLALTGSNTISTGGILVTSNATGVNAITGGTLAAGTTNGLVIINNSNLTISSVITGASASVTLSGTGTTTLSGYNTFGGAGGSYGTYLNSGQLIVTNNSSISNNTAATLFLNGGALQASTAVTLGNKVTLSSDSVINGASNITLSGNFTNSGGNNILTVNNAGLTTLSGTLYLQEQTYALGARDLTIAGTGNVAITGAIQNTGTANANGLIYAGSGILTLSNTNNNFGGGLRVNSGVVSVNSLTNESVTALATTTSGSATINLTSSQLADLLGAGYGVGSTVSGTGIAAGSTITAISGTTLTLSLSATSAVTASTLTFGTTTASVTGSSFANASSIVLNGGTLQYTGGGGSTNRLFSIGTNGGTLDASGSGAIAFTNTSTLGNDNDISTNRTLTLTGTNSGANTLNSVIADNVVGITSLSKTGSGQWVLAGINTYTGATSITGGTLSVIGSLGNTAVTVGSGATLAGSGTANGTVNATGNISGNLTFNNDVTINYGATASASAFNANIVDNGTITSAINVQSGKVLSGSGTVSANVTVNSATVNGNGLSLGATTLIGSSTLKGVNTASSVVVQSGSTALTGTTTATTLSVSAGATLDNNGIVNSTVDVGGLLKGSGTINGSLSLSGTLAPGNSPGTTTINGDFTVDSTAKLAMEITGATSGEYDQIKVSGHVTLAGTLDLTTLSGLTMGNSITLIDNTGTTTITSGYFTAILTSDSNYAISNSSSTYAFTVNGKSYLLNYAANADGDGVFNDVTLSVVPEPSTWLMLAGGIGMLFGATRMRRSFN